MWAPLEFDPQISGNLGKLGLEQDFPLDDRHFLAVFSHLFGKWSSPLFPALKKGGDGMDLTPCLPAPGLSSNQRHDETLLCGSPQLGHLQQG